MTDSYIRLSTPVKAFRFDGQPQDQWPAWLLDHKVNSTMGMVSPALAQGVLLIPQMHGPTVNVVPGQYVVLEGGKLAKFTADQFAEAFVAAGAEPATQTTEPLVEAATVAAPEPVAEAPAAAAAPEPVAEKPASRTGAAPAPEAPAAEADAAE